MIDAYWVLTGDTAIVPIGHLYIIDRGGVFLYTYKCLQMNLDHIRANLRLSTYLGIIQISSF